MRLSVVMIARNERENVRPCFDTFWDHADEVVLCDTGSRDGTIGEARAFARDRGEPEKLIVGRFKWCDDFAAARNHAHSLASGEWHASLDLDDRLVGAEHLRELAAEAPPGVSVIAFPYEYSVENFWAHRAPRLFRWQAGQWEDPVHETWQPAIREATQKIERDEVRWIHVKDLGPDPAAAQQTSSARNRAILAEWIAQEPDNPRALEYWFKQLLEEGRADEAERLMRRFLRTPPERLRDAYLDADRPWTTTATLLAEMLRRRGDQIGSRRLATQAVARDRRFAPAWILLAGEALDEKDYLSVIKYTVAGLEHPGVWASELCRLLVVATAELGLPLEARPHLQRAMRHDKSPQLQRVWDQHKFACTMSTLDPLLLGLR
jgi:glycosyltransferase involved in cell wall biosynthesis